MPVLEHEALVPVLEHAALVPEESRRIRRSDVLREVKDELHVMMRRLEELTRKLEREEAE